MTAEDLMLLAVGLWGGWIGCASILFMYVFHPDLWGRGEHRRSLPFFYFLMLFTWPLVFLQLMFGIFRRKDNESS